MADYDFETDLQNQHERNNAESDDFVKLDPDTVLQAESGISAADDREEAEEDLYPTSTHMHVSGFNSTDRPLGTFDDTTFSHHDDFLPEPEEEHPLPDSTERPLTPEPAACCRSTIFMEYEEINVPEPIMSKEVYQPPPPSAPPAEPEQSKSSTVSEGGWIDLKNLDPRDSAEASPLPVETEPLCSDEVIRKIINTPSPSSPIEVEQSKISEDGWVDIKSLDPQDSDDRTPKTSGHCFREEIVIEAPKPSESSYHKTEVNEYHFQPTSTSSPVEIEPLKSSAESEDSSKSPPEPYYSAVGEVDYKLYMTKQPESLPEPDQPKSSTFCEGGWIDLKKLDPLVVELIYWRDIKKTGVVFGSVLVILLSLSYFSLLSVLAYLSLAVLCVTFTFRLYKNVLQVVQKSNDGHPFKPYLEKDITIPEDKVQQATEVLIKHANCVNHELRRLFLVEDLMASVKFGVLLWVLTYIGAWFNGMTLVILAFVALFTLPKVYETYKTQIDHYLMLVQSQINNVLQQVKSKVPIGKKEKAQ